MATVAKFMMGAGIGAGIAYSLKCDKLTIFSCIVAGMAGANASGWLPTLQITVGVGNPIGAYLAALISAEICSLVAGRTKLDIIVLPLLAMLVAGVVAVTLCPPVTWLLAKLGEGIALATEFTPFFMGIIIAVVMGILLTLPTSSAAIWVAIALNNTSDAMLLAGGAAVVGCCCRPPCPTAAKIESQSRKPYFVITFFVNSGFVRSLISNPLPLAQLATSSFPLVIFPARPSCLNH